MKDSKVKTFEFKDETVEKATAKGLAELGLTEDQVEINVKSYGGIFTKPCVQITVKEPVAAIEDVMEAAEEITVEAVAPIAETEETAEAESFAGEGEEHAEKVLEEDVQKLEAAKDEASVFVTALIAKMGLDCEVNATLENGEICVDITGTDAGAVIGYRGEALDAIQYYTLLICNKAESSFIRVQVDAAGYRKKRKDTLASLAMRLARKTAKTGRKTSLEPMNPFERRVIHTTLANDRFVTTVSEGEGRFRHVVIVPKPNAERGERRPRRDNRDNRDRRERNYTPRDNSSYESSYDDEPVAAPKAAPQAEEEVEFSYGVNSSFRKKGPVKTRSFGGKTRKF